MLPVYDQRRYLIPFESSRLPHLFTDTLVVGGGVAGLRAALEAAADGGQVTVLVKGGRGVSSSAWAQGGIAAAVGDEDSPAAHAEDTIGAGAGLCDEPAVRALVEEAPAAIDELLEWGMRFDRDATGALDLGREAAHGAARILHAEGAATGRELMRCLRERASAARSIRVFDDCFAIDLLTADLGPRTASGGERRVVGAITHHPRFGLQIIWASATVLATGGAGQVYRETTNPRVTTGDGLAMAYRAGALVGDLEFVQFHPTTLYVAGAGRFLISEAVRGEGAVLVDRRGDRIMAHHPLGDLAPRDVVSRAIVRHLRRTRETSVYLDARGIGRERFARRFPGLVRELAAFDLDPGRDLVPVHPSAHYMLGGVWTDLAGRTSLPGLLACGEAACLGLHGANRLASNSLLEGLVYGRRTGRTARTTGRVVAAAPVPIASDVPAPAHAELDLEDVASSLRSAMWRHVGIEREGRKLDDVLDMFNFWGRYTMDRIFDEPEGWEIQNMLTVGALVTRAARWRAESRGAHCRLDHPQPKDDLAVHARWRVGEREPLARPVDAPPAPVGPA